VSLFGRFIAHSKFMKTRYFFAALTAVMLGMPLSSSADNTIPFVYNVENTGTNCTPPPLPGLGQLPLVQPLPDPFVFANGGIRSTNFSDWECRRNEIMAQIQNYEIGIKPTVNASQIAASYTNGTLTVKVTVGANTLTLSCPVTLPSSGSGPFPVCIGMDSPYGSLQSSLFTSRNIAGISYYESQVTTYNNPQNTDPFFKLYGPTQNTSNTGQYAAWCWGVSRVIDGLYALNGTLGTNQIDLNHIAVTGCSYAGKLALFSGAFDERIALTVAQESGGGGANSWRYNQDNEPDGTVEKISNTSYQWFSANRMQQFGGNNVSYLPEDHHELDAMVAPRALYVTGNTGYTWLGNPSCYVCSRAAQQIFNTLGIPDRFGFNIDGGHNHCDFPSDQTNDLAYFLDKFMLSKTNLSSVIGTYPGNYASINYNRWIQWWGTGDPVFPELHLSLPASTTKGAGMLAGQGNVSINGLSSTDQVVNLASSDTSKLTVPASVVIPAGQSNVLFNMTVLGDSILNGDQLVTISATSSNFDSAHANITIHDTNSATLVFTLPASASESAGTLANAGMVSIGTPVAANFTVTLTSSNTSSLVLPPTTVISTGQTSAVFNVTVVDQHIIGGSQNVSVNAHVPSWVDGSTSMTILYDDPMPDHFAWSNVPSPQWIGAPFPVTVTAQDVANNTLDYRLPVTLSALSPGNAIGTNTILNSPTAEQSLNDSTEYVLGYSFTPGRNLKVTAVRSYFGDIVTIWTAGGQLVASQSVVSTPGTWVDTPLPVPVLLLAGDTYLITTHVTDTNGTYFLSVDLPMTFADGTINQSVWDYGNGFPTQFDDNQWYFVDLRYATDVVSVPVSPGTSANFSGGAWSGNMSVLQTATNVILEANTGSGVSGISNPFNVLATPKLAITTLSNSVVLSWPAAVTGFNLEQTATLSNWTTVAATAAIVGSNYNVTNTLGPTNTYYRLHKP
jgi:hypothetical protein